MLSLESVALPIIGQVQYIDALVQSLQQRVVTDWL